jgi:hypothetical protein
MRGINQRELLNKWDLIIQKICEDCTPHDVLGVVVTHLNAVVKQKRSLKLSGRKEQMAIDLIKEAMEKISPEN